MCFMFYLMWAISLSENLGNHNDTQKWGKFISLKNTCSDGEGFAERLYYQDELGFNYLYTLLW